MSKSKTSRSEKYQNINISIKNKKALERIKRELERFHNNDFRIDVAIDHILKAYKAMRKLVQNRMKDKHIL